MYRRGAVDEVSHEGDNEEPKGVGAARVVREREVTEKLLEQQAPRSGDVLDGGPRGHIGKRKATRQVEETPDAEW